MVNGQDCRRLLVATGVIGFGLGGFFDGILLHQVLQWHHLLSLVPGEAFRDLGTQILADGLFHVLMYLVTASGLWLLWRRRRLLGDAADWRLVAGGGLLGFGLWNVVDVGFFHWILGIHRIRVDVSEPMLYDLGWLAAFGLIPLAIAVLLLRGAQADGTRGGGAGAAVTLGLLALLAAPIAALPQPNADSALVLFAPGSDAAVAINAAQQARTPLLWANPEGGMMSVALDRPGGEARLYEAGALFVTRSPALAGCAAALRT
ncbi:DUF2243 domain-containing protein [Sphingosinicella sp. BN140058]|uniref:DUF2243 domain-containing protein n=1 Tax=Sphingosinicella sp. BN140058 TaxID=1892855 RepID=UPI001012CC52|nr:DUF2243 domain-containing protein [Sphingosinicella sp. BN140058]QAY79418.1 DUF2243 domain-containing protein [Sphingosinicella sp. BN140058]